jgi:hypothetical protein
MATLSVKGSFGTLLFLMLFFICALAAYVMGDYKSPVFYFLVTMAFFLFLAVLSCIDNIRTFAKIVKKTEEDENKAVVLDTCPDYWTRTVVRNPSTQKLHTLCRNVLNYDQYVSGSVDGTSPHANAVLGTDIQSLREMAVYPETADSAAEGSTEATVGGTEDVTETFIEPGHPDYDKHWHRHKTIDYVVHDDVVDKDGKAYDDVHGHTFYNENSGHHSHYPGEEAGISGLTSSTKNMPPKYNNYNHWISPYDNASGKPLGMEINLSKLNEAENKCELANTLPWTEANVKCE